MKNRIERHPLCLGGIDMLLDPDGIIFLPATAMLVVADLHLEKGSAYARRGSLLPPYDTDATLERLSEVIDRYQPKTVVSLGDSFHDRPGSHALHDAARQRLRALVASVDWIWVRGNHDPDPPVGLGGRSVDSVEVEGLHLRHQPNGSKRPMVIGHLHPKARLATARKRLSRPCFAGDGRVLVMPAFGSYTGGLNVLDPAIADLFETGFEAYVLGISKIFPVPHDRLSPEPPGWRDHIIE